MTTIPDWILDGYERSGLPAFEAFARQSRASGFAASPVGVSSPPLPFSMNSESESSAPVQVTAAHGDRSSASEAQTIQQLIELYSDVFDDFQLPHASFLSLNSEVGEALSAHLPKTITMEQTADQIKLTLQFSYPGDKSEQLRHHASLYKAFAETLTDDDAFGLGRDPETVQVLWEDGTLRLIYIFLGHAVITHVQRVDLMRRVVAICQLKGVAHQLRELYGLLNQASEVPREPAFRGSLKLDEILSTPFLHQAELTLLGSAPGEVPRVLWTRGTERHVQRLMWQAPGDSQPYPVISVSNGTQVDTDDLPDIFKAAFDDHFKLGLPGEWRDKADHPWLASRTLTPSLRVQAAEGKARIDMAQPWPIFGPITPELLRYLSRASFGQFRHVMIRAGYDLDPDLYVPGETGTGDRSWLTTDRLLALVGDHWIWQVGGSDEVRCVVQTKLRNGPSLDLFFSLKVVSQEDGSVPALSLHAHTQGGIAPGQLKQIAIYNRSNASVQLSGAELPVSLGRDGNLTVRQIVLCPNIPNAAHVRHLLQVAERTLSLAAYAML